MTAVSAVTSGRVGPAVLAVVLALVSWHTAWNLAGPAGAVGYAAAVLLAAVVVLPAATRLVERAPGPVLPALVALVAVTLVVTYALGVPPSLGELLGVGSDRANALDVALGRLVDGRYPYAATTYLGHPISPLPGALLLAAPFWALTGDAGTQNVAWTLLLVVVLAGGRPRARPALLWALAVLGGLEVLREFLVGDDLVTGVVPALIAAAVTLRRAPTAATPVLVALGVALGVTTCTRPHLVLVLAVVVTAVGVVSGRRRAAVVGATAALTWAALVAPFLLGGTARFSPLHVAAKVTGDRGITPGIVGVALLAALVVALVLSRLRPATPAAVGWCAAAVLVAPSLLSWVRGVTVGPASEIDLTLGAGAVPFVLWAIAAGVGAGQGDPSWSTPPTPWSTSAPPARARVSPRSWSRTPTR